MRRVRVHYCASPYVQPRPNNQQPRPRTYSWSVPCFQTSFPYHQSTVSHHKRERAVRGGRARFNLDMVKMWMGSNITRFQPWSPKQYAFSIITVRHENHLNFDASYYHSPEKTWNDDRICNEIPPTLHGQTGKWTCIPYWPTFSQNPPGGWYGKLICFLEWPLLRKKI